MQTEAASDQLYLALLRHCFLQPDGSTDGYTGDYKAPQLLTFLQSFLPKEDAKPSSTKKLIDPLPHLTLEDFEKADLDEGMALVGFYAGSEGVCGSPV